MQLIRRAVTLTRFTNETLPMLNKLGNGLDSVQLKLHSKYYISLTNFMLSDGSSIADQIVPKKMLINNPTNRGLAPTMLEAYGRIVSEPEFEDVDVIITINAQHNPDRIVDVLTAMQRTTAGTVCLPIFNTVSSRPYMSNVYRTIADFDQSLALRDDSDRETLLDNYRNKFLMGFQAFRRSDLVVILPHLQRALEIYQGNDNRVVSWGFDFLTLLIARHYLSNRLDFIFGGWANPRAENPTPKMIEEERRQAWEIIVLFEDLYSLSP